MRARAFIADVFAASPADPPESALPSEGQLSAADRSEFERYVEQQRPQLLERFLSRRAFLHALGQMQPQSTDARVGEAERPGFAGNGWEHAPDTH